MLRGQKLREWMHHGSHFVRGQKLLFKRSLSSDAQSNIRNIGIFAHVDHGKTTVTERMLHYSGKIRRMGSVDAGNTTMDFLPQERERGITINSAAISFEWKNTMFNLIDTPGHVDFTFETQRSLRVLDGGILVLDAVSGVQSQTMTVWRQANHFSTPRFAFVNKMDRDGASVERVEKSIRSRLGVKPITIQMPLGEEREFYGVIDLVGLQKYSWKNDDASEKSDGSEFHISDLNHDDPLFADAIEAREKLIEDLTEFDDELADLYLTRIDDENAVSSLWSAGESHYESVITDVELWEALERTVIRQKSDALVLLCGAALRNVGVQPLMDAAMKLLPSPLITKEIQGMNVESGELQVIKDLDDKTAPLVASAFKVQHDFQRGSLVFFRVYRGKMKVKDVVLNTTLNDKERINKLLVIEADSHEEVSEVAAGQIGAAVGLKATRTGDTLIGRKTGKRNYIVLDGIDVPPPVFTSCVTVPSSSDKPALWDALKIMEREDPSIRVVLEDPQTEETLVSGMGELHMEVVEDKLKRQFKLPQVEFSPPGIAFRESLSTTLQATYASDSLVGDTRHYAKVTVELIPHENGHSWINKDPNEEEGDDKSAGVQRNDLIINFADIDQALELREEKFKKISSHNNISFHVVSQDGGVDDNETAMRMKHFVTPLAEGVERAFASGPLCGFPISGVCVKVIESQCEFTEESSHSAIAKATERAIKRALDSNIETMDLLEPIMSVEINSASNSAGAVLSDLNSTRRATVREVGGDEGDDTPDSNVSILANVPLREMVGYSTSLRSLTSGEGNFSMHFLRYDSVLSQKLKEEIVEDMLENPISTAALDLHVFDMGK